MKKVGLFNYDEIFAKIGGSIVSVGYQTVNFGNNPQKVLGVRTKDGTFKYWPALDRELGITRPDKWA